MASTAYGYFQQEVNYKIAVSLDDEKHLLRAFETIEYTNNSPDELTYLWFHLWPNAYKNQSTALAQQLLKNGQTNFYFSTPEERGYIDSLNFQVNGKSLEWEFHPQHIDIAKIQLPTPLQPGETITISTPFKVKLPIGKFSRLGHIGQQYQITQWYPKPAVYDKNGWHEMPYLNQGEFYSEFGSFEVSITLPQNYRVGATGDLQESSEIMWMDSLARRTKYIKDYPDSNAFPPSSPILKTITYTQQNVHDFAWFADKRYHVLKGEVKLPETGRKVTTWVLYTNPYADIWKDAIPYVNDALFYYSKWNGEYPYNQCTAVDGALSAGGGMEYPNVTVIGAMNTAKSLENVIMHEVGHNWFYGILGSNERQYPWMDEGLNTFNEIRYMNLKFPADSQDQKIFEFIGFDHKDHFDQNLLGYRFVARLNRDQPINTSSTDMRALNYGLITYFKSGVVFTYLRNLYGNEKMDAAMKNYFEQWKFKHPYPEDLQKSLEESLGESLDWFFDQVIDTKHQIDYAICSKKQIENGNYEVKLKNKGEITAPLYLLYGDSSKKKVEAFEGTNTVTLKDVKNLQVGSRYLPDVYPSNNFSFWQKPIELKFLSSVEDPAAHQIFWTPTLGWNNYNKTMLGLALHNIGIPHKKLEFLAMPMFSLAGENQTVLNELFLGSGEINYRFHPNTTFRQVLLSSAYSGYALPSFGNFDKGGFLNWENSIRFDIEPSKPNGNTSSSFRLAAQYIEEVYTGVDPSSQMGIEASNENLFVSGDFYFNLNKTINTFTTRATAEWHEDFLKLSAALNLKHQYHKRGSVDLRVFAGAFAFNNSTSPRYNWRMDGRSGMLDYRYQEIFPDRGGIDPVFGQQFILSEGGFKVPTAVGQSNEWIASSNVAIKAPIKIPVGVFADAGISPFLGSTEFLYDAGVYFPLLGEFFTLYMPFVYSANINSYLTTNNIGFAEQIRFTLRLKSLNPISLRESIQL